MAEIKAIGNIDGGSNPGYIRELFLIKKEDIAEIENPFYGVISSTAYVLSPDMLRLTDSAEITKINFVWRSCSWFETSKTVFPVIYDNAINFELSGNEVAISKWVMDNVGHEFIAIFGNRANDTFIVGNIDVGLGLSYTRINNQKNFIGVSLTGAMVIPTFHTSEIDVDSFFNGYEFSNEFNVGIEFS